LKFLEGSTDAYDLRGMDYPLLKPEEKQRNFTLYDLGPDMGSQFIFFNQNTGINPQTGKNYIEPYKLKWFTDVNFRKAVAHIAQDQSLPHIGKRAGDDQQPRQALTEIPLQKMLE
jgi:peptide/nickel transport system substrate-binding protein